MEKGILYLACTALLLGAGVIGVSRLSSQIAQDCRVVVVHAQPSVSPTAEPSATPSAALKTSVKVGTPAAADKTVAPTK